MASVPRRTVRLRPSSGRSFRTTVKPNSSASAAAASYCVTTVTCANSSAGTASSERRSRLFPSTTASSLLRPKRLPLPAAMTRQPMRSSAMQTTLFRVFQCISFSMPRQASPYRYSENKITGMLYILCAACYNLHEYVILV